MIIIIIIISHKTSRVWGIWPYNVKPAKRATRHPSRMRTRVGCELASKLLCSWRSVLDGHTRTICVVALRASTPFGML